MSCNNKKIINLKFILQQFLIEHIEKSSDFIEISFVTILIVYDRFSCISEISDEHE